MATRGAQIGNSNAVKGRRYREGIMRALARESGGNVQAGIDRLCTQLVRAGFSGEQWALQELGNRLDGKPVAQISIESQIRPVDISDRPMSVEEWTAKYTVEGSAEVVEMQDSEPQDDSDSLNGGEE